MPGRFLRTVRDVVYLFSCMRDAAHMRSGAGNGGDTVGNQTDRQPGGLYPWSHRLRAGIDDYAFHIFFDRTSYCKGEKRAKDACVAAAVDGAVPLLDSRHTADRSGCVRRSTLCRIRFFENIIAPVSENWYNC